MVCELQYTADLSKLSEKQLCGDLYTTMQFKVQVNYHLKQNNNNVSRHMNIWIYKNEYQHFCHKSLIWISYSTKSMTPWS
jgi:hypothetical protein